MNWLGNWLVNQMRKAENQEISNTECVTEDKSRNYGKPLNIRVYNATGGKVITFQHYDYATDKNHESTYIIHPEEELADSLAKLIVIEELRRE